MRLPSQDSWLASSIALALVVVAGCDQPGGAPRHKTRAPGIAGVALDDDPGAAQGPAAAAPAPATEVVKPRPIIGQKTQDIRDADQEKQAGGVATEPKIVAKDPIRLVGNAYVSIVGKAAVLNMQHTLDLYQAETGEYPKTLEEFMEKIVKPSGVVLPTLPFYQEYAYDVPTHSLIIMEYPARKQQNNYPK